MKFLDYGFKRLKARIPIWIAQIKGVMAREGLLGFVKRVFAKVYRYVFFSGDPHKLHKLQFADWMKNVEAKYLNKDYYKKLSSKIRKKTKFSIVFAAWNKPSEMTQKALDSIVNQYYDNWEVCISDGSSKYIDETIAVLKTFVQKYPGKAKINFLDDETRNRINIIENRNACIKMASGDYLVFLDTDDELAPNCLLELAMEIQAHPNAAFIYSDFDKMDTAGVRFDPSFWPDWSPHTILSHMYTTHVRCFNTKIVRSLGGMRKGTEGADDWDLVLRLSEKVKPAQIRHIPKILYHWRVYAGSTALPSSGAKNWAYDIQLKVLSDWMKRNKIRGEVTQGAYQGSFRVKYAIVGRPKVSIIIPFRDKIDYVKRCVDSIIGVTEYENYEIVLVDNQSELPESKRYMERLPDGVRLLSYDHPFHFGKINNWAAGQVKGEHVLFLNNDTKVMNGEWLSAMLEYSQQVDVGAVGGKMYYPDGKIQHAGIIIGMGGGAAHGHRLLPGDQFGYNGWLVNVRDVIGVTGACLMIKRKLFLKIGGFDIKYDPGYQDVDLCLRLYEAGYWNVFTPFAQLFHYESVTRFAPENKAKLAKDEEMAVLLRKQWSKYTGINFGNDPFYNPNLSYDTEDFRMRTV